MMLSDRGRLLLAIYRLKKTLIKEFKLEEICEFINKFSEIAYFKIVCFLHYSYFDFNFSTDTLLEAFRIGEKYGFFKGGGIYELPEEPYLFGEKPYETTIIFFDEEEKPKND